MADIDQTIQETVSAKRYETNDTFEQMDDKGTDWKSTEHSKRHTTTQ